jgi:hypothetical protein
VYVSISIADIADIFPPNRRFDFLPISSRQFDESISIADFFPPMMIDVSIEMCSRMIININAPSSNQ